MPKKEEAIEVDAILDAWIEEEGPGRERRRVFKVMAGDGREYLLAYDEGLGAWFLRWDGPRAF